MAEISLGGLSSREIAAVLDIHEAAVRQRLTRARKQFQQLYVQESGEEVIDNAPTALPAEKKRKDTHLYRLTNVPPHVTQ